MGWVPPPLPHLKPWSALQEGLRASDLDTARVPQSREGSIAGGTDVPEMASPARLAHLDGPSLSEPPSVVEAELAASLPTPRDSAESRRFYAAEVGGQAGGCTNS